MEYLTQQIQTRDKDIEVLKNRLAIESNQLNGLGEKINEIQDKTKLLVRPKKNEVQDENQVL